YPSSSRSIQPSADVYHSRLLSSHSLGTRPPATEPSVSSAKNPPRRSTGRLSPLANANSPPRKSAIGIHPQPVGNRAYNMLRESWDRPENKDRYKPRRAARGFAHGNPPA